MPSGPTPGRTYRGGWPISSKRSRCAAPVARVPQRGFGSRGWLRASARAATAPGALVLAASESLSEPGAVSVTETLFPLHHPVIVEDHPPAVAKRMVLLRCPVDLRARARHAI